MEIFLQEIDKYLKRLEDDILSIVSNQTIPLMEKNRLMKPIVDQKSILLDTKKRLIEIQNREYQTGCTMSNSI